MIGVLSQPLRIGLFGLGIVLAAEMGVAPNQIEQYGFGLAVLFRVFAQHSEALLRAVPAQLLLRLVEGFPLLTEHVIGLGKRRWGQEPNCQEHKKNNTPDRTGRLDPEYKRREEGR